MLRKPTYEELLKKVKLLEAEKRAWMKDATARERDFGFADMVSVGQHKNHSEEASSLGAIINVEKLQSIMDDFHFLTGMVTAILDMNGTVIEATGWQDICTKFHRIHPKTAQNCTESDLYLTENIKPGEYIEYRCKNGLWDVATPLYIGNRHLGNIYTGQFFYDDDSVDEKRFIQQAEAYGFNKEAYLDAFHRIPRYSRETIRHLMHFLVKFTSYISTVSYANMKLEMEIHERKLAEAALQESDDRLRSLINALPDLVWLKDIDGVYLACNARFEKFFGAKEEAIVGKTDYDFKAKDLADFFRLHDKAAIEKGGPNINEEEITFAEDGHREILETIKTPMYSIDGRVVGVLGIGRDITDRKAFTKALRESESCYRELFNNIESGVAIYEVIDCGKDFIFKDFNRAGERIDGDRREDLVGKSIFDVRPGIDRFGLVDVFRRVWKTGIPEDFPAKIYEDERLKKWYENFVYRLPTGEIVAVFDDVTERKKADIELRESEEKFRNFTEQSFVGFYIIQDGLFKYVNPKLAEIFGYSVQECLNGMHFSKTVYEEDLAFVQEHIRKRMAGEADTAQYTFRGVQKRGDIIHVSVYGSSLIYEGKLAAIGTMLDITKELELEKRMAHAQRMEAIGSLAGGIAHDFNNILFPIIGLSEMLIEDLTPGSPEHEKAQQVFNAGNRGSDLVKQILTFSRQSEHKKMPIRIQQILKEVMKLVRSTLPSNINIIQDIQNDCSLVQADPTQVHQVAMNLITNAYHAVEPKSGEIIVRLGEVEIGFGQLPESVLLPGRYALLSVSDTGIGIDAAVKDKIFEPYFTTKAPGKGTGLGLAVVYGIVREHHGDIKVYSEFGTGTTFNVYLPIMAQTAKTESIARQETLPVGHERILLVDDEAAIARLEKEMLERLGYRVTMCVNSVDALDVFKSKPDAFDLVVSDMTMPKMTGDRLAFELIAIRPTIPILICTGFSERINKDTAEVIGVKGVLTKPIDKAKMARMVRKVLDEHKITDQG